MIPIYVMTVPWDPKRFKRSVTFKKELGATLVLDEKRNAMDTFRLLLAKVVEDGDGEFFLFQDDVILAPQWREKAEKVVREHPGMIVQFFSMENEVMAKTYGSRELPGNGFISNLCIYVPKGYASQILAYSYEFVIKYPHNATADDYVIRQWLHNRRETYWMHYPNLVQHEGWASSINAKRPRNRKSNYFDGDDS